MIASLLLLLQAAAAPGGPASPPHGAPMSQCQAFATPAADAAGAEAQGTILYVGCGGTAVRVGRVESYRSSYNPGTRSLAVVVHERGRTRVLVARQEADGTLQLQDLSRDLAKVSGRPFDAGLRPVEIDLRRFESDGSIAAPVPGRQGSEGRLDPGHYATPGAGLAQSRSESPPGNSPQ